MKFHEVVFVIGCVFLGAGLGTAFNALSNPKKTELDWSFKNEKKQVAKEKFLNHIHRECSWAFNEGYTTSITSVDKTIWPREAEGVSEGNERTAYERHCGSLYRHCN